jgi:hypothetical protein
VLVISMEVFCKLHAKMQTKLISTNPAIAASPGLTIFRNSGYPTSQKIPIRQDSFLVRGERFSADFPSQQR